MTLAELEALQGLFHRAIVHPTGIDAFLRQADANTRLAFEAAFDDTSTFDRRARLTVYADAYFWRLHGVLTDHFGLVAWLLGPARFRNLVTDYVLHCPSTDPDIRRFGAKFAAFIATHTEHTRIGDLASLAAIEWAMVRALDIPQPTVLRSDRLATLPPAEWPQMRLQAVPSAFIGGCRHDFAALWAAHGAARSPDFIPTPTATGHVLVWRQGHDVLHRSVDAREAAALSQVCGGVEFATLCEDLDATIAVGWLSRWLADGVLADL